MWEGTERGITIESYEKSSARSLNTSGTHSPKEVIVIKCGLTGREIITI